MLGLLCSSGEMVCEDVVVPGLLDLRAWMFLLEARLAVVGVELRSAISNDVLFRCLLSAALRGPCAGKFGCRWVSCLALFVGVDVTEWVEFCIKQSGALKLLCGSAC